MTGTIKDKDTYYVAVKVFLEKEGKFFIFKDGYDKWDLPGGRIKREEFATPFEEIIHRKMVEELGPNVKYKLGKPEILMRHERVEHVEGNPTIRIFAVGYRAEYLGGEIELASHHKEILWADHIKFKPQEYFSGGWLKGVEEYLRLIRG